ncbi:MAG TPA: succinate dehydrogenase, cytochrome b556 subunit [Candidatus Limnocylindrales bacterium]|nr:succinate dehydrogenase, cytochrome b556 subunit [Candidatus Limnocylindrales bacterium]
MIKLFGYQVSWAQLAWFGHRASGIGVLVFLFLHIVETSTVLLGPEVYDFTQTFYANLPAKIGEVVLMAALVYHALNGLRVIAMDFWPSLTVWYRPLTYGVIAATIIAMVPLGLIILSSYLPFG